MNLKLNAVGYILILVALVIFVLADIAGIKLRCR